MKARPKKPGARNTAAKKPAAGKRAAVARKAKVTAKPAKSAHSAKPVKPAHAAKPVKATASRHSRAALGAECTIEHAPELQKQLAKVLDDRACVTLDFSAVKRCDTAGMQVLAAFIRERREAGRGIELASLSGNFLATAKLLGLSALFEPVRSDA
jgi:anti-anti-sigma regulatory factor